MAQSEVMRDLTLLLQTADRFLAKGAYDKALAELEKVIAIDPGNVRVLEKLGNLYVRKNDHAKAAHCLAQVAAECMCQGLILKAAALYKQVLKLDPSRRVLNLQLAGISQQFGLPHEALTYFQLGADYYKDLGNIEALHRTLDQMVQLPPNSSPPACSSGCSS